MDPSSALLGVSVRGNTDFHSGGRGRGRKLDAFLCPAYLFVRLSKIIPKYQIFNCVSYYITTETLCSFGLTDKLSNVVTRCWPVSWLQSRGVMTELDANASSSPFSCNR
jgi:hypothetical protein